MGYDLIKVYKNKRDTIRVVVKDKIGYIYDTSLYSLKNHKPTLGNIKNPYSIYNISLWLINNKKTFRLKKGNMYLGAWKKLNFYCETCKESFNMSWFHIYIQKNNCPSCSGRIANKKNNFAIKNPEILKEWDYEKNGSPKRYSSKSRKKVWWNCSKNKNHNWISAIYSRAYGSGCPHCSENQKESRVASELKSYFVYNYNAKTEYKILKNPKTKRWLPYDIYIPHLNIYIEVHGKQHYNYNKYWHKNKRVFKNQKYKDKIKKDFAKKNGIYIEIDLRKIKSFEEAKNFAESYFL